MTDKKSNENRRNLLKSIAAGSGVIVAGKSLPESWSRPVVDSVMLPAHAQTSPPPPPPTGNTYATTIAAGQTPPGAIGVTTLGGVADITIWFEITAGVDLSVFQVSGVPIGPTSFTNMVLTSQSCGFVDICPVSCVAANGVVSGQFELTLEGGPSLGIIDYSAPIAPYIPIPPADCSNGAVINTGQTFSYRNK